MLDYTPIIESKIAYWNSQPTDRTGSLNSFNGTFNISDVRAIPEILREYLAEKFDAQRLTRISLEDVNKALNDVWEGPGSAATVVAKTWEMRMARKAAAVSEETTNKLFKNHEVPTIDDNLDFDDVAPEKDND